MYPAELEIKDITGSPTSVSNVELLLSMEGMFNFTLLFMTNEMISISTPRTFRSWVAICNPPMFYLSAFTICPGVLRICMFYSNGNRLSSKLLKQGYLVERLKSSLRKFYGRHGYHNQHYEVSLSRMLNEFPTLYLVQWLPNGSDFPPVIWPYYRYLPSPNNTWSQWNICNGCGMPADKAFPPGNKVTSQFLGLAYDSIVETIFTDIVFFLDFYPWIPLDKFSLLLASVCFYLTISKHKNEKNLVNQK